MSRYKTVRHYGESTVKHRVIAEIILGRQLPKGSVVHHIDGNGLNNSPNNLLICPSQEYHKLLHYRENALNECGNANWLKCVHCKKFGDPEKMMVWKLKSSTHKNPRAAHYECSREEQRIRRIEGRH